MREGGVISRLPPSLLFIFPIQPPALASAPCHTFVWRVLAQLEVLGYEGGPALALLVGRAATTTGRGMQARAWGDGRGQVAGCRTWCLSHWLCLRPPVPQFLWL